MNPQAHKHKQICGAFTKTQADVFGMAKLNLNFKNLSATSQWHEQFQRLYHNHSILYPRNQPTQQ
jgi:phage-related tail fiber protein